MIDHEDLWQVLAQHAGSFVEYEYSTAVAGPKIAVRARIHPKYDECDSKLSSSPGAAAAPWWRSTLSAPTRHIATGQLPSTTPSAPFSSVLSPPPPPEQDPQQPAGRTASEEQRAAILGSVKDSHRKVAPRSQLHIRFHPAIVNTCAGYTRNRNKPFT